ncbi:unnamed protein product [Miscanthus lutarioriparius]|uniref:Secreted protein n=1 Tax=Miscanthus lutarioriparius TaxID=422564 RepID=A0A811S2T3_9POAL|nr:unnamed protein product [Miscanthus lutarioriparius]
MMGCCSRSRSRSRSRVVCPVPALLLMLLLLLSPCSAELNGAAVRPAARRLLVSRPSTSRQKAEEQQMKVGGRSTPFKQAAASFGRRIPRSGWNPIQNR